MYYPFELLLILKTAVKIAESVLYFKNTLQIMTDYLLLSHPYTYIILGGGVSFLIALPRALSTGQDHVS